MSQDQKLVKSTELTVGREIGLEIFLSFFVVVAAVALPAGQVFLSKIKQEKVKGTWNFLLYLAYRFQSFFSVEESDLPVSFSPTSGSAFHKKTGKKELIFCFLQRASISFLAN